MGWGHCGTNPDTGEEMGYAIQGVCRAEGCDKAIDHGLSYVCGGEHEGGERGCGYYFCTAHLRIYWSRGDSPCVQLCEACGQEFENPEIPE